MNESTRVVRDSLNTMVKIRREYINNYTLFLHNHYDKHLHNRIYAIYSVDVPEILRQILFKLNLIEESEGLTNYNVKNVLDDFFHLRAIVRTNRAFDECTDITNVEHLADDLRKLAKEMQNLFNKIVVLALLSRVSSSC